MELEKMNSGQRIRFYHVKQYVDVETAEIMTESMYLRGNYRIINKTKEYEFKTEIRGTKQCIIRWWNECKKHEQLKLFE